MTNEQKFVQEVIQKFLEQKGKGSCYAFSPVKPEQIVITFIKLHREKRTDTKILIVCRDYEERCKFVSWLNKFNLSENVTILTQPYVKLNYTYNYDFSFLIGYNEDRHFIEHIYKTSRWCLNILTKLNDNKSFIKYLNEHLPIIRPNVNIEEIKKDRFKLPVEEIRVPIQISDDDLEQITKYDDYIKTSMAIFGSFENADKCRVGDNILNISAGQFRYDLARENGWNERLDTSIEFNKKIDEVYNPNSLLERANILYNIIRERLNMLTDNNNKLPAIVDIINKHLFKKILIVSKRGEFANTIANYINENTEFICGEYHDCIPEQYIKDDDGNYIVYKSGENKGKRKLFKSKALSTMCLNRFNSSDNSLEINLLSMKNSSDSELKTAIDVIIFTSSVCLSPNEFIERYNNIDFKTEPIITYVLYCSNTIEERKLGERHITNNVSVIENEKNVQIDEESGAVYLQ